MELAAYVGIDPGNDGAITVNIMDQWRSVKIPILGNKLDIHALNELFKSLKEEFRGVTIKCAIEDVHAVFGASATSTFNFGFGNGALHMVLVCHGISYTPVQPKTWQKEMWAGVPLIKKASSTGKTAVNNTKAMSEMAAKRLFPTMNFKRTAKCTNNDDGIIDSVLICEYARRKF